MEYSSQVEKSSNIQRKLTIKVPAEALSARFNRQLAEVQKSAKIKGFRPGHVPINLVKEYYGPDVRNQVFERVIDESYRNALKEHSIRPVGQPKIDTQQSKSAFADFGNQDFVFIATVEILPEITPKGYTGLSLTKEKVEVTDSKVSEAIQGLLDQQAQIIPLGDSEKGRAVKMGDFVDFVFNGGIVTDTGVEERPGMKGNRVIEIGSNGLIPGFEENMIGCKAADTKTFRIKFPDEYAEKEIQGKEAEFTVTINEIKEKKLPELTDEFAKEAGFESVADMKAKARESLTKNATQAADQKLRGQLLQALIEKNTFDVPEALLQAQTRAIAQEVSEDLRQRGFNDAMIQEALGSEFENIKKRADNQVRAGLLLEAIAKVEKIAVQPADIEVEIDKMAEGMKIEKDKVKEFYDKNPSRKESLEFRLLEDRTVQFILDKAKIK